MNTMAIPSLDEELVIPLERLSRTDLELAGGKAANLGELIQAGFPVPPGFVLTTRAYDLFVKLHDIPAIIPQVLDSGHEAGSIIRAAFESFSVPVQIEQPLMDAYQKLGNGPVAVRSSATAEDLPGMAFAGQQDTYLNIVGPQSLLDAVRRCWASLWTDRAIAYRDRQGIDQLAVKLAVVVQVMVMPDVAGVMFTANPVTGRRDEIVLDANPGLGEAVVSGEATPDHYVLIKKPWGWSILERRVGRREMILQARPGEGTEHVKGKISPDLPAFPDPALKQIAKMGAAIQRHFGSPQDVEWAWARGDLFILQARPVTALPEPLPRVNKVHKMLASNFGEIFSVRPYPLDMGTWIPALSGAVEPVFRFLGLEWNLHMLFEGEDDVVVRFNSKLPRPTWRLILAPLRIMIHILQYNPLRWQADPLITGAEMRVRALESALLKDLTWQQLLAIVYEAREVPYQAGGELRVRYFPRAAFAMARLRVLLKLLGHEMHLASLLSGAQNKTIEVNHALEQLAGKVRSDPGLSEAFSVHPTEKLWSELQEQSAGPAFLADLQAFLDCYGHRESVISTVMQPTWKDAPEVVLGLLKGFLTRPMQHPGAKPAWQAAQDEILGHSLLRFPPFRSAFLKTLAEARLLLQIREDTHFYATLPMPIFRRTFLEFGWRLVQVGVLDTPEEVFHLNLNELERVGGNWPPLVELASELRRSMLRRKTERARLEDKPLVDPRLYLQSSPVIGALLLGMPGSPGVAEGPARILLDSSEFYKLVEGDVLVAPFTNPSWTPLFQRAAAVVVDSGSLASHAAIVAREYGIPAVMSTVTGTKILHDGERIRVDGSRGAVFHVTSPELEVKEEELKGTGLGAGN